MMTLIRGASSSPGTAALFVLLVGCSGQARGGYDAGMPQEPDATVEPDDVDPAPIDPPEDEVRFYHFDVGQADATLVWAPEATVLIDAGDWRSNDVPTYLDQMGIDSIDLLVLTHPHADHIGQAEEVIKGLDVTEIWMSGWEHSSDTFDRTLEAAKASDAGYHEPKGGETQELGELAVEVLNPDESVSDVHDCLALRISYRDFAAIYTGDAEAEHEADIIEQRDVSAQLLQLGHHGSRTSSTSEFLEAVDPEMAIYSAAEDSQYGHPHAEVLERLESRSIDVYGTPEVGTVLVTADDEGFEIQGRATPQNMTTSEGAEASTSEDCIDLNSADAAELERIVHTGPARAEQMIELRPFASISELERVEGLGEASVKEIAAEGLACVR